jgi:hypothetical protein
MSFLDRAMKLDRRLEQEERRFGVRARLAAQERSHVQEIQWDFARYRGRPLAYFYEVLKYRSIWDRIEQFISGIHDAPHMHILKSGHKVGKTRLLGGLVNYWFDCFDPGIVMTVGASEEAMEDTLWSEVRLQRREAGLPDAFLGPASSELWSSPNHWAKLFSVKKSEALQGKHRGPTLVIFDEATAIERIIFTVMKGIFKPEPGHCWICCYNPTDPSTPIYAEEQSEAWQTTTLSSLDHPNIVAQRRARLLRQGELYSDRCPIPNAVSISQVDSWVKEWTQQIEWAEPDKRLVTDFEWQWPDGRRTLHRPMLDWEARCTGNWPSQESSSIWSDHLFTTVSQARAAVPIAEVPEIGCDVAGRGEKGDFTSVHSRWGCLSLGHVEKRGIRTTEIVGLLIETARGLAEMVNRMRVAEDAKRPVVDARHIPIKVDDDNLGGAVVDQLYEQGYNAVPVRAGMQAMDPTRYPNKRSELWFTTANRAQHGGVAFCTLGSDGKPYCRLDRESLKRLKLQAVAPRWKLDSIGRRVVEPKDVTKERLGRSPDDMDAMNLAYYECGWDTLSTEHLPQYDVPHLGPQAEEPAENWARGDDKPRPKRRLFGP